MQMGGKEFGKEELTIGIVGLGSYATIDFFRRIVDAFPGEREWDRPRVLVDNYCTMPSRVRAILYGENRTEVINALVSSVKMLIMAGAKKIILACGTAHVFLPEIIERIPEAESYLMDMIEICGKYMKKSGITCAGLAATEGTIATGLFRKRMEKYGIMVHEPDENQYVILRSFIETVKQNKIDERAVDAYAEYLNSFENDAIILGCTELPILYRASIGGGG